VIRQILKHALECQRAYNELAMVGGVEAVTAAKLMANTHTMTLADAIIIVQHRAIYGLPLYDDGGSDAE